MEHNAEVSTAIQGLFGSSVSSNRHLGLRLMLRTSDNKYETVWANGQTDWVINEPGSCAKYNAWTSADLDSNANSKFTGHIVTSAAQGIYPGQLPCLKFISE